MNGASDVASKALNQPIQVLASGEPGNRQYTIEAHHLINNLEAAILFTLRVAQGQPEFIPAHVRTWLDDGLNKVASVLSGISYQFDVELEIEHYLLNANWFDATKFLVAYQFVCDLIYGRPIFDMDYFLTDKPGSLEVDRRYRFNPKIDLTISSYKSLDHFCNQKGFKSRLTQRVYADSLVMCTVPSGEELTLHVGNFEMTYKEKDTFVARIRRGYLTKSIGVDGQLCMLPFCAGGSFIRAASLNPIFFCELVLPRNYDPITLNERIVKKFDIKAEIPFSWMSPDPVQNKELYGVDEESLLQEYRTLMGI